jgi:putative salt-induced outer membrane protein YdiY
MQADLKAHNYRRIMVTCLLRFGVFVVPALIAAASAQAQGQPPPHESYIRRLPSVGEAPFAAARLAPSSTTAATSDLGVEERSENPVAKPWDGSFELGLAGTEGPAETFNFRFGSDLKRKAPSSVLTLDLDYKRDTADGRETASQLFFEARHEWERENTAWNVFAHTSYEYDGFKAYDYLVALDAGISRIFFDTDINKFKGRIGGGVSKKVGIPNDEATPELIFGLDFKHKVSDWQQFKASADYYPSLEDLNEFRLIARVDWELLLDAKSNLSLKIGIIDRYDTTPSTPVNNTLDYSTVLLWKF